MPPTIGEHPPAPITPEASPAAGQMPNLMPTMPIPDLPTTNPLPTMPAPAPTQATTSVAAPPLADDSDLIEKAWVEKAKTIVAETRDDPFAQSREVSRFKADYIKKRYNKDIKLPES